MIVQKNITIIDTGHIATEYHIVLMRFLLVNGYKTTTFTIDRHIQQATTRTILGIQEGSVDDLVEWLGKIGIVEEPPRKTR